MNDVEEEILGLAQLRRLFKENVASFVHANSGLRINKKHLIGEAMWAWLVDQHLVPHELQRIGNSVHHGRKTGKDGHPLWRVAFRRTVRGDEVLDKLFDGKRIGPTPLYARLAEEGLLPQEPGELMRDKRDRQAQSEPVFKEARGRTSITSSRYLAQNEFELHMGGLEWVYVYTTARELRLYQEKGVRLLLKVGSTRKHYVERIAAQAGSTAANSTLVCVHACRVHGSAALERRIHNALKAQDRHIKDAPGIEWFDATPAEVEMLLRELAVEEERVLPWAKSLSSENL